MRLRNLRQTVDENIGATGCALAWGVIDGVTLVLNSMFYRGWRSYLIERLHRSSVDGGIAMLRQHCDHHLSDVVTPDMRSTLYHSIMTNLPTLDKRPQMLTRQMLTVGLVLVVIALLMGG